MGSGGEYQVSEGVFYLILWSILSTWSAWVIYKLMGLGVSGELKKLQPIYLAIFMVSALVSVGLYTACQVFDNYITWKVFFFLIAPSFSFSGAIVGLMVFRYYVELDRLESFVRQFENEKEDKQSVVIQTKQSERISLIESSILIKSAFVIIFVLFSCSGLIFLAVFGNQQFYNASIVHQNRVWMFLSLIVGSFSLSAFVSALLWVNYRIKKLSKEADVREVISKFAVLGATVTVNLIVFYATPLVEWSHRSFDVKPLCIMLIPYSIFLGMFSARHIQANFSPHKRIRGDSGASTQVSTVATSNGSFNSSSPRTGEGVQKQMKELLDDAEGFELLLKAAKKEFAVENVLFYKAVQDWKQMKDTHAQVARAKYMCDLFLSTDSDHQINISIKTRTDCLGYVAAICKTKESEADAVIPEGIFDKAVQEVVQLIYQNTYMRLRKTKQFADYISQRTPV